VVREVALGTIVDAVSAAVELHDRVLVGIDGPDAAGKTTLADKLAALLPWPVMRASIDDFQQPNDVRYRRGELSPEGYYHDGFDHARLIEEVLDPFCRNEFAAYRILIVDGVFLQRPELCDLWTLVIYLEVSMETILQRALVRDLDRFASVEEIRQRYVQRYLPAQALYRDQREPERRAHLVIDNN
jgi:uridine kinase